MCERNQLTLLIDDEGMTISSPDGFIDGVKKLVADGKLYKYCGGKYTKYKVKG